MAESKIQEISSLSSNFLDQQELSPDDVDITVEKCSVVIYSTSSFSFFLLTCAVKVKETDTGAIVGGVLGGVAAVFILFTLFFLWFNNRPLNLTSLPQEVRWQYEKFQGSICSFLPSPFTPPTTIMSFLSSVSPCTSIIIC